jgi:hypothetical protein
VTSDRARPQHLTAQPPATVHYRIGQPRPASDAWRRTGAARTGPRSPPTRQVVTVPGAAGAVPGRPKQQTAENPAATANRNRAANPMSFTPTHDQHTIHVPLAETIIGGVHRRFVMAGNSIQWVTDALEYVVLCRIAAEGLPGGKLVGRVCDVGETDTGAIVIVTGALYEQLRAFGDPRDVLPAALTLDPHDVMYG